MIWTRAAIDTALWFVCLKKRTDEPPIAALLDVVRRTGKPKAPLAEAPAATPA